LYTTTRTLRGASEEEKKAISDLGYSNIVFKKESAIAYRSEKLRKVDSI